MSRDPRPTSADGEDPSRARAVRIAIPAVLLVFGALIVFAPSRDAEPRREEPAGASESRAASPASEVGAATFPLRQEPAPVRSDAGAEPGGGTVERAIEGDL